MNDENANGVYNGHSNSYTHKNTTTSTIVTTTTNDNNFANIAPLKSEVKKQIYIHAYVDIT